MNWMQISGFVGAILITLVLAFLFRRMYRKVIMEGSRALQNDPTKYTFLGHILTAMIYCVGLGVAIYQVDGLRSYASSMLAGAGILAVAVGFASQQSLGNIMSGLFIVIFRPYKINDRITVSNQYTGIVEDITLRHTVIRDFENRRIVIPNSIISNETVINSDMLDQRLLKWVDFSIAYDADIDKARAIIHDYIIHHPLRIDGRTPQQIEEGVPELPIRVVSLGDSSVNLRTWVWTANSADAFVLSCDAYEAIKKAFDEAGVEIPYPHRTLVYKDKKG